MKLSTRNGLAALVLLLPLVACDLEFVEEEITWRHDPVADTLDVLLVYHGVMHGSDISSEEEQGVQRALDALDRVVGGAREFMILNWPLYWNLESWEADEEILPALAAFRWDLSVRASGLFMDEVGRLSGYQHLHLENVSTHVASANRAVREEIRKQLEDEPEADECEGWREAFHTWLDSGGNSLFLNGNSISFEWPSSADCTRLLLAGIAGDLLGAEPMEDEVLALTAGLLAQAESLALDARQMAATVGREDAPELQVNLRLRDQIYDPSLLGWLRERGEKTDGWPSLEAVRGGFDALVRGAAGAGPDDGADGG